VVIGVGVQVFPPFGEKGTTFSHTSLIHSTNLINENGNFPTPPYLWGQRCVTFLAWLEIL